MSSFSASDPSLIVRNADLAPFRRGSRWLVLASRTGASILLEGPRLKLFGTLARPLSVQKVHELNPELPEVEIQALLGELYQAGMLQVAGYCVAPPERERPPLPQISRLTLRVAPGCSPSCPECALRHLEGPVLESAEAVRLVEEGMERLAAGPICLDLTGGEPLRAPEAIEAAIVRARELRPGLQVAVRTGGWLVDPERAAWLERLGACVVLCLHEAPGRPGLEEGPLAVQAAEALRLLPEMLGTGLACAPVGVARRPGQGQEFFNLFMGMGYRTMRLEFPAPARDQEDRDGILEAMGDDLLAVAEAICRYEERVPVRVRVHPLEEMIARLGSGQTHPACGHPECSSRVQALELGLDRPGTCLRAERPATETHPRCSRCPFWNVCGGGCRHDRADRELDPRCRMWLRAYEGLLWLMHEHPAWASRREGLQAGAVQPA